MSARTAFYLLPQLYYIKGEQADELLGSIVQDFKNPRIARKNASHIKASRGEATLTDFQGSATASRSRGHGAGLEGLADYDLDRVRQVSQSLDTKELRYWFLENAPDHFAHIKSDKDFLAEISPWVRTWPLTSETACMVVGLLVCDGGQVKETRKVVNNIRTSFKLPIVTALAASYGIPPLQIGDPSTRLRSGNESQSTSQSTLTVPTVIGVEYRWIYFRALSKQPRLDCSGPVTEHQLSGHADYALDEEIEDPNAKKEAILQGEGPIIEMVSHEDWISVLETDVDADDDALDEDDRDGDE